MRIKLIATVAVLSLLIGLTIVFAQQPKWTPLNIISILFGEMPRVCTTKITPLCISCLVYVKLLPFAFFFATFFLIFFYLVHRMFIRPVAQPLPGQPIQPPPLAPTEIKVITVMSFVLTIIMVRSIEIQTILSYFQLWIGIVLFVFTLLLSYSIARLGAGASLLIAIIIFLVLWMMLSPLLAEITKIVESCM